MRKPVGIAAILAASLVLAACGAAEDDTPDTTTDPTATDTAAPAPSADQSMYIVPKLVGVAWFNRMEEGANTWAERTGIATTYTGPQDASPENQVNVIQDLLASKPTAITVVPNSPESLNNVFQRARDEGIIIVTHEASNQENMDADIEAFQNSDYGALIMENLAQCMGEEGQYAAFVGNLTAQTHMEWVDGALAKATADYPNIERVVDPIESNEDEQTAYERATEIITAYPDIKGFQGSAGTDVAGIARAVAEAGLTDEICVMGTGLPSVAKRYLEDGSIDKIFFWDPARAGEAMLEIALRLANGETIGEGTDLGIEGYESLTVHPERDNVFFGQATVVVDVNNVNDYNF